MYHVWRENSNFFNFDRFTIFYYNELVNNIERTLGGQVNWLWQAELRLQYIETANPVNDISWLQNTCDPK